MLVRMARWRRLSNPEALPATRSGGNFDDTAPESLAFVQGDI
jgi:hypothetical protein